MRKLLLPLLFLFSAAVLADTPFQRFSKEYRFDATTSSGTPVRITATNAAFTFTNYRIFVTCSSATAVVTLALGEASSDVTTVTAPVAGVPQPTTTYPCGVPIEILGAPSQAYVNAIVSTGTAALYIQGGGGI